MLLQYSKVGLIILKILIQYANIKACYPPQMFSEAVLFDCWKFQFEKQFDAHWSHPLPTRTGGEFHKIDQDKTRQKGLQMWTR